VTDAPSLVLMLAERPGIDTATAEPATVDRATTLDAEGFGALLDRETPVLLAAARAVLLHDADAQDLVQTTLEVAWRHRAALRDPAAGRGWLLTIQMREAFRWRRRLARFVRLDPGVVEIPGPSVASADTVAIRDALRRLTPRVRAAVVLHHMVGLPVGEVAQALGTSPNTVKTQLRVGLARLREELRDG
jgi:RNA polymerase sigma-70 factor (ECF subfamily)